MLKQSIDKNRIWRFDRSKYKYHTKSRRDIYQISSFTWEAPQLIDKTVRPIYDTIYRILISRIIERKLTSLQRMINGRAWTLTNWMMNWFNQTLHQSLVFLPLMENCRNLPMIASWINNERGQWVKLLTVSLVITKLEK